MNRPPESERRCVVCREVKPIDEFARGRVKVTWLRSCHACYLAGRRQVYRPSIDGARSALAQVRTGRKNQERMHALMAERGCVDCGERDPIVLEFDHVRGDKRGRLAELARRTSWATIAAEIAKCEVRCANCHRRRTAQQLGWYRHHGRDHDADYAAAMAEVTGQPDLFSEPLAPPRAPTAPPLLGAVAAAQSALDLDPREFSLGEEVRIAVACVVADDGSVHVTHAAILGAEQKAHAQ